MDSALHKNIRSLRGVEPDEELKNFGDLAAWVIANVSAVRTCQQLVAKNAARHNDGSNIGHVVIATLKIWEWSGAEGSNMVNQNWRLEIGILGRLATILLQWSPGFVESNVAGLGFGQKCWSGAPLGFGSVIMNDIPWSCTPYLRKIVPKGKLANSDIKSRNIAFHESLPPL